MILWFFFTPHFYVMASTCPFDFLRSLSPSPLSPLSLSSPISPPLLGFLSHLRSFNDFPSQHFKMERLRVLGCVIAAASYCCLVLLVTAQTTDPSEVKALLAVKSRLIDPHNYLGNWSKGDPCISNWNKVVCSNETGNDGYLHIKELLLLNMNLSGNLAPELGQLSHLWIIDFMWNGLTGTIPKEIGKISSLTLLLLNGNKLSGSLPEELGYLSNLNRLQVDQNQMSGPIPKSFANLVRVKHLHMNNNSFSGQIPSELSQLPLILHLLLDSNNLSGHLPPELSNLTEMRILQLDNNNFGFEIPASFGNLSRLVKLSLRNCSLQGVVPDLSKIANLTYLDLSRNHLIGPIPSQKLSDNMTTIDLSYNNLNGSIPGTFLDLPSLQKVDLRNNSLSDILGDLDPPANVSLRLENNPICTNATGQNIGQFCRMSADKNEIPENSRNPNETSCQIPSCPLDNFYEFVPNSTVYCFCAAPIRIGYRLKSPSFSYFRPYYNDFKVYLTSSLDLDVSQLIIDSFSWEEGPRLRMYLKLFPMFGASHSNSFNTSEVQRIKRKFTSWEFPRTDFFGPYELLNFTLWGPYSDVIFINEGSSGINKGILAAIVLGAIACLFTISAVVFLLITRHKYMQAPSRRRSSLMISIKIDGVKIFTFKELSTATQNFDSSTLVGRGGYGKVYKGILADETIVAIKRAEEGSLQGQKEFLTEIELLSRLHHRNLVSLIGYCDEEEEQMLVYEFMPNGTLRDWLSAKAKGILNFSTRLRIALGSAKGILYLHTEAEPPIFHRDIKATNILLDSNLTAKVADFGLSRLAPDLDAEGNVPGYVSTVVKGTPGYLDPEYFLTRKLTDKSDVYSLGVVFLELLTCMHPISHGKNIVREVMTAHQSGIMFSVIDSRMGSYPSECVERFATLALSCCDDKTEKRPPMLAVVRELENILKMMPDSDIIVSESTSTFSVSSTTQSSSFVTSSSLLSSSLMGSDLVSGVIPTITPR